MDLTLDLIEKALNIPDNVPERLTYEEMIEINNKPRKLLSTNFSWGECYENAKIIYNRKSEE